VLVLFVVSMVVKNLKLGHVLLNVTFVHEVSLDGLSELLQLFLFSATLSSLSPGLSLEFFLNNSSFSFFNHVFSSLILVLNALLVLSLSHLKCVSNHIL
jgi:hypothetical protein